MTLRGSTVLALLCVLGSACAARQRTAPATPAPAVVRYDMEEMRIEASPEQNGQGVVVQSFDAQELFERAGAALSASRLDEAIGLYDKLLASFPESAYARPGLYNRGLAHRDRKDWAKAIESFRALAEKYPDHADAKDALFQLGACFAEQGNWPASGEVFVRLLDRKDLNADDRIEAMARRGFAQFNLKDVEAAEKTFRQVLAYKRQIEGQERLATDFYLSFAQYHLAQVVHERFRAVPLRFPQTQLRRDLEAKFDLLVQARNAYVDTVRIGDAGWAAAAGFQIGSLYEELHTALVSAPIPPELQGDARQVYAEELRKEIRILLEKAVRWHRENLLMIERVGVKGEWAEKTRLSYAKLLRLLDPSAPVDEPAPAPAAPAAPPTPTAPNRDEREPAPAAPSGGDDVKRQIL